MLIAFTVLLVYQLIGEVTVRALQLPLPGPVLGMLLLFMTLLLRGGVPASLQTVSNRLLSYLSLLFVPAGVGIITHLTLLQSESLPLIITLLVSTILTMVVTGLTLQRFLKP